MGFIDAYKHLEKLCGEILNDDRRVSAYIDEMLRITNGSFYVGTWNEDLKKLKHYRWIRNQIAHEPNCNEFNMCKPEDEVWLQNFYSRIMNQTDPLSQYDNARHSIAKSTRTQTQTHGNHSYQPPMHQNRYRAPQNTPKNDCGYMVFFILTFILLAAIGLLLPKLMMIL